MENNFGNAVKAFIVRDGKLLLIKRAINETHHPGMWDNPGGRLDLGENPFTGLLREVREEVGLDAEIIAPLDVHFFTRDDGQKIQLTVFVCKIKDGEVILSDEHTEYQWKDLNDPLDEFPKNFQCCVSKFKQFGFVLHMT